MKIELNKVYKDRLGGQWKTVCKSDDDWFVIVNREQNSNNFVTNKGRNHLIGENPRDLIELVGDDFMEEKKPREFKFNAYLTEYGNMVDYNDACAIDKAIGKSCGGLRTESKKYAYVESKWEVKMKEIIN